MSIYYSQTGQDKFLETSVFKGLKQGVYMDVGAHDGISINNTLYFNKTNRWNGVNIEPIKEVFDRLVQNRPDDINLNCAIAESEGEQEFIHNTGYSEMLSGLKSTYDLRHYQRLNKEIKEHNGSSNVVLVPTKRIATICNDYNIHHIHYLSIDVEGAEFSVIKSIDFEKVFIDVIGFENNYNDKNTDDIITYLSTLNYRLLKRSSDIFMIHNKSLYLSDAT